MINLKFEISYDDYDVNNVRKCFIDYDSQFKNYDFDIHTEQYHSSRENDYRGLFRLERLAIRLSELKTVTKFAICGNVYLERTKEYLDCSIIFEEGKLTCHRTNWYTIYAPKDFIDYDDYLDTFENGSSLLSRSEFLEDDTIAIYSTEDSDYARLSKPEYSVSKQLDRNSYCNCSLCNKRIVNNNNRCITKYGDECHIKCADKLGVEYVLLA